MVTATVVMKAQVRSLCLLGVVGALLACGPVVAAPPPVPSARLVPSAPPAPPQPAAAAARGERVLASGPGYLIKAVPAANATNAAAPSAGVASAAGGPVLQHRHFPIVCQGPRLLHIDGLDLQFDGNAVTAEDGCEVHITNSHIVAKGVAVSAHAASVHIRNSSIQGAAGSVKASNGAQVYLESSRFKGLKQRLGDAVFHDLGGNTWN